MIAVTSLSPAPERRDAQREAIASWRAAGLQPQSLNHPWECVALVDVYDVEFVPCEETTLATFGRHCIPVNALLAHLVKVGGPGVLLNSDIVLRLTAEQLARFVEQCSGGLGYLVKYNHDGDESRAIREPYGIDVFVFDASTVEVGASSLSMGQPVWDYWLPHEFLRTGRKVYTTDDRTTFHRRHLQTWDMQRWEECAAEFFRLYQISGATTPPAMLAFFQELHARINAAPRLQVLL
jgi:hypothetical protein